ncbi:ParB/RepB/Spo0J family partition protein [Bifidobacterium sp. ESL0764]|uniref:ParB/RepB/Spo0J family partition protein n=1 Tax=Bifidobacterium sp. ESL0764 TaxID=2983228 RepID=UPI0023F7F4A9|nr:ParB/RepB/Spo0J family partition protein [Bifidobacterium sp. ESL0764]WEV65795.1 ParB/RepB/Spo0J family partition protein [Bifidobacterium sp. ESL0764]
MASKSRLGKGLGALFPALPGEPEKKSSVDEDVSESSKQSAKAASSGNVSRETSLKRGAAAKKTVERATSQAADNSRKSNVSRETSKKETAGVKETATTALKTSTAKKAVPKKNESKKGNVSRETSSRSMKKRVTMPSLADGMAHPSDLFFGSTVEDGKNNTASKVAATRSNRVEETKKSGKENTTPGKESDRSEKADRPESGELKPVEGGYLVELDLDAIGPNANQPRTIFDEDELKELAASLKEVGVLQPVVVRKRPTNQKVSNSVGSDSGVINRHSQQNMDSEYELIMGERRWRAAHLAGLKSIPAIVKTTSDNQMLRDALLENLHRVALNPLEESAAYQQMMQDFGLTQEQLSKSVSKSRSQIANTLRLLNLPPSVQKKVAAGVLSAGHARALLGLPNEEDMEKLANRIIAEGLSVRSTEEIVAMKTNGNNDSKKQKAKQNNPWAQSPIQHTLENRFDTKVAIKGNKQHGRIEIVFSSPEDMDRIVKLLVPRQNSSQQNGWV